MKSPRYVVPMLVALSLAVLLSGCSKNTTPTAPAGVSALDQAAPALPSQIVAETDATSGLETIQWNASSSANVAGYQLYKYSPDPERESAYVLVGETDANTTQYVLNSMTSGTYYYRLRATSTTGVNSEWSPVLQVVIGTPLGGDPENGGIILKTRP